MVKKCEHCGARIYKPSPKSKRSRLKERMSRQRATLSCYTGKIVEIGDCFEHKGNRNMEICITAYTVLKLFYSGTAVLLSDRTQQVVTSRCLNKDLRLGQKAPRKYKYLGNCLTDPRFL